MYLVKSIPLGLPGEPQSSGKIWKKNLANSSIVKIATGYITEDAIIEIKKITECNPKPNFELFIGMHYFDLFTKTQYDAVNELNTYLLNNNRGHVFLSSKTKFHGKIYSFSTETTCFAAAIGSSNLGSFVGTSTDLYEVDCCFDKVEECTILDSQISQLITSLGTPFNDLQIDNFDERSSILDGEYGVEKAIDLLSRLFQSKTEISFSFPLKTEPKSNLNAYFGKGRITKSGFEQPRPWYEVEVIVPSEITSQNGYPVGTVFKVCTEDGWMFDCYANGDYAKNLRSANDLKILGKWIKGRMEAEGALTIGQPITESTLDKFGRHNLRLTKTSIDEIWLLEMF